jgi:AraC family transcriptional regulator
MPIASGQFVLLDRNDKHEALTYGGPADCISMYTSREALDRFQEEHELRPVESLRAARGLTLEDPVIKNLGDGLLPALERSDAASQLFVDYVALALLAHLSAFYGEEAAVFHPIRGGLAPWQERRTEEMLLAHIDGKIGLVDLAREPVRRSLSETARSRVHSMHLPKPPCA